MSFPRYQEYKDSGVGWLGNVPEHWAVDRLKNLFTLQKEVVGKNKDKYKLLSLTLEGVIPRDLENPKGKFPAEFDTYQVVHIDDLVFCLFDVEETPRAVGISSHEGMVTGAYTVCRANKNNYPKYLYYYYLSKDQYKSLKMYYTGLRNVIRTDTFFSIPCLIPPLDEQISIAKFLDDETAKIDSLIEEQEELIELLKEKRQAVISHAVTRGLDPNIKMKDSGVEWLGQVPEHWTVERLKFLADIQTGDKDTENAVEDGKFPFFVRSQIIENINSYTYDCEAILTAGDGAGVGKVFHYFTGKFDFHQRVYMLNNFRKVLGKYLFLYFKETFYKVALEGGAKSTVDSLRRPMLMNFPICVPSANEQLKIIAYCDQQATRYDELMNESEKIILVLSERRSALISAAVTGQIDVRSAVTNLEAA